MSAPDDPTLPLWRVEATVVATQHVRAASEAQARALAVADPGAWDVDLDGPILDEHIEAVTNVSLEDEDGDDS